MRILLFVAFTVLASSAALAQGYASPYGEWRGQAQYQAFIKSVSDAAAHAVTDLKIDIDPRGKVVGASAENGCLLLGIAAPGATASIVVLNITLTGCQYAGLDRTYKGQLSLYAKKGYASLSLQALDISIGKGGTFNITSTMRR